MSSEPSGGNSALVLTPFELLDRATLALAARAKQFNPHHPGTPKGPESQG